MLWFILVGGLPGAFLAMSLIVLTSIQCSKKAVDDGKAKQVSSVSTGVPGSSATKSGMLPPFPTKSGSKPGEPSEANCDKKTPDAESPADGKPNDKKKLDNKKDEEKQDDDKKEVVKKDKDMKEGKKVFNKDEKASKKANGNEPLKTNKGDNPEGDFIMSLKPELDTNRTQPSKSVKVKDDDDTVKHIESLKEDMEKSDV